MLKVVGIFIPLRMSTENMEIGDVAEHGHEVYPSDIPSLGCLPGGAGRGANPSLTYSAGEGDTRGAADAAPRAGEPARLETGASGPRRTGTC